jgi:hypothetical protein
MKTNKRIKIITNSGFKYEGKFISQDNLFITLIDDRQGEIKVPLSNISLLQEVKNG